MPLEKQLAIFVQNKVGSLGDLSAAFSKSGINIRAFTVVDDLDWGIVKIVVDDDEKAREILHNLGLMYGESQVLTVTVPNNPGTLAKLSEKLAKKKINIEQAYATAAGDNSLLVLATTDNKKANSLLSKL